jgi:hypothetical protein
VPRKRNKQTKRTSARIEPSSAARDEFLLWFRKARDVSAAEYRGTLSFHLSIGDRQKDFTGQVDRWVRTFPALLSAYAEGRWHARRLEAEFEGSCVTIMPEVKNWVALACDGELPEADWRAPAYLAGWPAKLDRARYHLPTRMVMGKLSANATEEILLGVSNRLEEQIAIAKPAALNRRNKWAVEQERLRLENIFRHSADYRSITYKGRACALTSFQADIVKRLHEAHLNGTCELSQAYILTELDSETGHRGERLRDYFKRSNVHLWGKGALIVRGTTKGSIRVNLPLTTPRSK